MGCEDNIEWIPRENWETPEAKGGGKDGRDDAADARLIARHDGQHPCSLFPPLRGWEGGGFAFLQSAARLLVRR